MYLLLCHQLVTARPFLADFSNNRQVTMVYVNDALAWPSCVIRISGNTKCQHPCTSRLVLAPSLPRGAPMLPAPSLSLLPALLYF